MDEKFLNLSGLTTLLSNLKKFNIFHNTINPNNGKGGWQKLCSLCCSGQYMNTPVVLKIIARGYSTSTLEFMVENSASTTPKLLYAKHLINRFNGNHGQTSNVGYTYEDVEGVRTYSFWKKKNENWGVIHVQADVQHSLVSSKRFVVHTNMFSETEPEGIVYADYVIEGTLAETLPISKGGTGATTAKAAEYNLHPNNNTHLTGDLLDDYRIPCLSTEPSASNGVFEGYRKFSQIWNYIQSKISSVLGLTKDAYGGKAASATSADSATKATQDGSGNNIANTYATKEGLGSVNQSIAGLTSGVNSKLEKDGSNASSTTTYNVLNAAAGGGSIEITDDEEIIFTYPTGLVAYKRTLAKFAEWIEDKVFPIINRKLNAWLGNEQEVVFNNVKVRKGFNSSEVEVATYYGISVNYYNKEYIDEELSSLQESVDSKIGFENVKNITNSGMATNAATSSLPITIFYAGTGGGIASIYKAYVANEQEPLFLTCGRCIYLVNTTASNVTITGLSKGNYTLNAGKAMTIIYYTGTSGAMWYSPDVDD